MMDQNTLKQKIEEVGPWRHDIDFGNGIRTGTGTDPSIDPAGKWWLISKYLPKDLSGLSVLDIGGNSGYLAVQCKLRGAKRVVVVDAIDRYVKQAELLAEYYNAPLELKHQDAHIFTLTTNERFDYIIFSRVFYHLKYPNLVLDRLAEMTKKRLILATAMIGSTKIIKPKDDYNENDKFLLEKAEYPKMFFIEKNFAGDKSNWWLINNSCSFSLLRSAGLKVVENPRLGFFVCEPIGEIKKVSVKTEKLFFPYIEIE